MDFSFLVVEFLFIDMMYLCTRNIFCAVLTVGSVTSLAAFLTLAKCLIIFTRGFSIFCHKISSLFSFIILRMAASFIIINWR